MAVWEGVLGAAAVMCHMRGRRAQEEGGGRSSVPRPALREAGPGTSLPRPPLPRAPAHRTQLWARNSFRILRAALQEWGPGWGHTALPWLLTTTAKATESLTLSQPQCARLQNGDPNVCLKELVRHPR